MTYFIDKCERIEKHEVRRDKDSYIEALMYAVRCFNRLSFVLGRLYMFMIGNWKIRQIHALIKRNLKLF